jgi:hypothetical protein
MGSDKAAWWKNGGTARLEQVTGKAMLRPAASVANS